MTIKYILMKSSASGEVVSVFDREKEAVIPLSLSNADYQEYLRWIEDGNTPDEPTKAE